MNNSLNDERFSLNRCLTEPVDHLKVLFLMRINFENNFPNLLSKYNDLCTFNDAPLLSPSLGWNL